MTTPLERPGVFITESLTPLSGNNFAPGQAIGCFAAAYNQGPNVPTFVKSFGQFSKLFGNFATSNGSALVYAVYEFFANGGSGCFVLSVPNPDAVSATLTLQDVNSPPDNVIAVSSVSPGAWANNVYVAITTAGNTGRFNVTVYYGGSSPTNIVENFVDLSINPADPRYVISVVNSTTSGSAYINMASEITGNYQAGITDPALIGPTALSSGSDGVTSPDLTTAIPVALDMLQGQILNLNVPGLTDISTINSLITWAEGRGDVMIVVDGPAPAPPETSADVVANYVNMVTGGSPITSSTYVTLYAPWILVPDPASSLPGAQIWLPPGGAVLGIWSRTDNLTGPYQSPAGISYGQINLIDVEARFTPADLNTLNDNNINAIRFVPGYFPAIMGARTLEQGFPDRYIAVRRELIQMEHDFTQLLQFALFEPNDPALWAQISQILTNYLVQRLQAGAIGGSNPANAFLITCDDTNNTPATAQAGIVNCSVAVQLLSPAEFILINISQFQNTGVTSTTTTTA